MEEKYIKDDRSSSDTLLEVIKLPHDKTVKQNYQETKKEVGQGTPGFGD